MSIKVAFGATNLYKGLSKHGIDGIGHYTQELLQHFKHSTNIDITPYAFGLKYPQSYQLPSYSKYALQSILTKIFQASGINIKTRTFDQFDLVHVTDQLMPININRPLIATVMDVIPLTHPYLTPSKLAFTKAFIWKNLTRSANHIITISEFSKQQIAKHMSYPAENISVIPLGVNQRYFERIDDETLSGIAEKFNLPNKFFLHIGTIQPRKNIVQILHAHSLLPQAYAKKYPLVLAGRYGWGDELQRKIVEQAVTDRRCIHIDYVSDLEKRALLQLTLAMTFISLYEGFGLPVIEAFASRTPVITSATTSLIEVAGDAAVMVDPNSSDEIRGALLNVIQNQDSMIPKIELGYERAQHYSWESTASKTLSIYKNFV